MDGLIDNASRFAFFKLIFNFLDNEIATFRDNVLGGLLYKWLPSVVLMALTIWILWQGFLIVSGRSRESMMGLVMNSLRSTLIVTVASTMAFGAIPLHSFFSDSLPREVNFIVTGEDSSPADEIDKNLKTMEITMIALDGLNVIANPGLKEDRDRAKWMAGAGVAGPSVIAGSLMLMYKVGLALFVGLGPIFVLSLLFEQTKQLFSRWLFYGIGTMFSFSVLCFMVSVSTKLIGASALAFAAEYAIALRDVGKSAEGVSSMAMQQGGLGLVLTTLLLTCPPMAAMFFQGTLGNFTPFSQMGTLGGGGGGHGASRPGPHGEPPGSYRTNPRGSEGSLDKNSNNVNASTQPYGVNGAMKNVKETGALGAAKQ